ncbi:MAG TPA: heme biosynthesis HemY N-terminal domain-containing protein [Hyphomicrobiaceae bacterium]|nr:heme biosynthesis HemY N-terminal domain-containing protein [Hyphomicrobiaceae bacterium]
MLRLVAYLLVVATLAFGLSWLSDNPGSIVINWRGWIWETDVFQIAIILAVLAAFLIMVWSAVRGVWQSPAAIGNFLNRRREKRGLEALSSGMIAIGAGDKALATRYAVQARKALPNEPMTHLLRAQAAQLSDDRATSRRIFEAMLASPDTEALGLRGLFLEAEREGEKEAARQFASRAVKLNPKLTWPVDALFDIQCKSADWSGALETLMIARKNGHIERQVADRRRAVLLTAQAQIAEDSDPERAMNLALEAHKLAIDLVPAAAIAGRLLASRGGTPKATGVLQKTWRKSPHPDLAVAYAYARLGDSPRDRLERVRQLAALTPNVSESPIAVANAAIEAKDFEAARSALEPLIEGRLSQRVCTLMARVEAEQRGNTGAVREWLARAVNAPRDPAWTADGIVSEDWAPVSPVTGALDAFQWRVPVEAAEPSDKEVLALKIEELVKLGARPDAMLPDAVLAGAGATAPAARPDSTSGAPPAAAGPAPAGARFGGRPVRDEPAEAEVVEITPVPAGKPAAIPKHVAPPAAKPPSAAGPKAAPEQQPAPPQGRPQAAASTGREAPKPAAPEEAGSAPAPKVAAAATTGASVTGPGSAKAAKPASGSIAAASNPAAGTTNRSALGTGSASTSASQAADPVRKPEPKIFVAPRAPDDPGPDALEDGGTPRRTT